MLKNLKKGNKKGFTLVELVIVIAILAILVAIAIPTISHLIGNANSSVDESNANMMSTVIKTSTAEASAMTLNASAGAVINPSTATEDKKNVKYYDATVEQLLTTYGLDTGVLNVKSNTGTGMMYLDTNTGKVSVGATDAAPADSIALDPNKTPETHIFFGVDGTITATAPGA